MPGPFKFVRNHRNLCDVVRDRGRLATKAGENREITSARQIRTQDSSSTDFQFNAQQRVMNLRSCTFPERSEFIRPSAHFQNSFAIDASHPLVAELSFDLLDVFRGEGHGRFYLKQASRIPSTSWTN